MDGLKKFVDDARTHGWDDDRIRQTLHANGWQMAQIDAALQGMEVPVAPVAPVAPQAGHHAEHGGRPSITALQAALQHVLLWLFTLTSSIMVGVVSAALFGGGSSSSEVLLTYVVLELVTFAPFAVLYWQYVRRLKRGEPDLMTGKVWSIITIVLHSLGLIGSVVGFVLVIILVHNGGTTAGLVSTGTIGIMDALVVVAYLLANFAKSVHSPLRRRYLQLFPVLLFVLIATLGVLALLRVAPLRHDDQTAQNLVTTVNKIHNYANDNGQLPGSLHDLSGVPAGVTYTRTNSTQYKVCANFKKDHGFGGYSGSNDYPTDDTYVSKYDFDHSKSGEQCWSFQNTDLQDQASNGDGTSTGLRVQTN